MFLSNWYTYRLQVVRV